jgi:hypothetical protein
MTTRSRRCTILAQFWRVKNICTFLKKGCDWRMSATIIYKEEDFPA